MIDLPHEIQRLLAVRAGAYLAYAPQEERSDGIASIYAFGDAATDDGFLLETMTVCSPPLWFDVAGHRYSPNSGAHRVLLEGRHRGERMVVAIEEREDRGCEFDGEVIHVGVQSSRPGEDDPEALAALIRGAVAAATGELLEIPMRRQVVSRNARGGHERTVDRFETIVRPYEEIAAESCALSPAAKQCALFLLPESIFANGLEKPLLLALSPPAMLLM